MMTRLRQCSTEVIGRIKKMFTCLIKEAFRYRFKFQCPKYLCRVRDLSFLPHLLQYQMSWHEVTLTQLALELNISPNDLDLALTQPGLLQPEEGTHPVGDRLLNYRLDNNGALPTRMKSFHSWNLSSWVSTATQDYRLRRCKRLLRSGPICIQETKWKGPETEALYQSLPGVQIVHTSAVAFNERTCTGGVAILFPPGWQVLEEVILVKGRCVAALVQDRTCKFYVISVYIHPDNRNGDMEALLRTWRFLDKSRSTPFLQATLMELISITPNCGTNSCSNSSAVTSTRNLLPFDMRGVCRVWIEGLSLTRSLTRPNSMPLRQLLPHM